MSFNFLENIISKISISETLALLSVFSVILTTMANYCYQQICSKRYGVDKSNFEFNDKFYLLFLFFSFLVLVSIYIEYSSKYILKIGDNFDIINYNLIIAMVLVLTTIIILEFLNIYIFESEGLQSSAIFGLITVFIYYELITTITEPSMNLIIYKFLKDKCLINYNLILSRIFKCSLALIIIFVILNFINKKYNFVRSERKKKMIIIFTRSFICIVLSISFFYATVLFATVNAFIKVDYNLSAKEKIESENVDGEGDGDWVNNRLEYLKNLPIEKMIKYYKEPIKITEDDFIKDYKNVYNDKEESEINRFYPKNNKEINYEENLKENNILEESNQLVRVMYFLNNYIDDYNTTAISFFGLIMLILSIEFLFILYYDPNNKREFEVIGCDHVVISKKSDIIIVMDCVIKCENNQKILEILKGYKYYMHNCCEKTVCRTVKFDKVKILK